MKKRIIPKKAASYQTWLSTFDTPRDILNYFIEHEFTLKEVNKFYTIPSIIKPLIAFANHANMVMPYNYVNGIKDFYLLFADLKNVEDCQACLALAKQTTFSNEQQNLITQVINANHNRNGRNYLTPPVDTILTQVHYGESTYDVTQGVYWWHDPDKKAARMQKLMVPFCDVEHLFTLSAFYLYTSNYLIEEDRQFMQELIIDWCERPHFFNEMGERWSLLQEALPWYATVLDASIKEQFFQHIPLRLLLEKKISPWILDEQVHAVMDIDPLVTWYQWAHKQPAIEMEIHW